MKQYIDKSDVVAEIKRIMDAENESINSFEHHRNASEKQQYNARMALLERILSFLNTLEVKDVDMSVLDNGNMSIERWKEACEAASCQANYRKSKGLTETCDDYFMDGVQWADEHPINAKLVEELDYDDYMTFFKKHPEYSNGDWGFEETWTFGQYCYTLGLKAQKGE